MIMVSDSKLSIDREKQLPYKDLYISNLQIQQQLIRIF